MISRTALPLWVPTDVVVTDVDDDGRADVLTLAMFQGEDHVHPETRKRAESKRRM